jgi:hypothetical protein
MTTKEKTCAELVQDKMAERESEIKALLDNPESDYSDDPALGTSTNQITIVTLSWGGPADYLEITWDYEDGIQKVIYRYSDWFDTATLLVEEDSPLYKYAQFVIDYEAERSR